MAGQLGWVKPRPGRLRAQRQQIPLTTGGTRYRYYLVWITDLPPGRQSVSLNEITLYQYS